MRKPTVLLLVLAACSSGPRLPHVTPSETEVEVRGAVKGGPYPLGRAELAALPQRSVRGLDPESGRAATWEGTALAALVSDRVERTRGADVVIVRTRDRRAVPVPLTLVRQLQPVLADRADGQPLPERVIAWPTFDQRGLETDPRARLWWARGVVALELANSFTTYGRALAVPDGAADGARLGADRFGARCIGCHRVRKAGGEAGPNLSRLTDRMTADALYARMRAGHPGWSDGPEDPGPAAARQVWSFLRAVAAFEGTGAAEEPGPPEKDPVEEERRRERPPRP
ncbi:c-type cytochrome [Anaeromyxobacter sp. PSR-1]|uniref:c-type cytochrome n=1 Tax=unclassified Anaeromyxobacter TaxID=2620896 RepID=UPI0005E41A62|nr:c-type cytochrome [Anaeromyxobacter sp. PSR-1]GAO02775.1 hypothetical protein PSR1_01648 [Anaeromyxobacter sp. PSR-1]